MYRMGICFGGRLCFKYFWACVTSEKLLITYAPAGDGFRPLGPKSDTLPRRHKSPLVHFFLFDLILYVHSTIFQLCGTGLPGLNQY